MSRAVRRLRMVLVGLAAFMLGLTVGLLLRPISAGWLEAVGTWVGAMVGVAAVILAVLAFRWSEDFIRLTEHVRQEKAADEARQVELGELQDEADRLVCEARYVSGTASEEPEVVLVADVEARVLNNSSRTVINVQWRTPQLGGNLFWLSDAIAPGERVDRRVSVTGLLTAHEDHRELHRDSEFIFSLGGARWSKRYGRPAERLDR